MKRLIIALALCLGLVSPTLASDDDGANLWAVCHGEVYGEDLDAIEGLTARVAFDSAGRCQTKFNDQIFYGFWQFGETMNHINFITPQAVFFGVRSGNAFHVRWQCRDGSGGYSIMRITWNAC